MVVVLLFSLLVSCWANDPSRTNSKVLNLCLRDGEDGCSSRSVYGYFKYFEIEAKDEEGNKLVHSDTREPFTFSLNATKFPVRNKGDGTYFVVVPTMAGHDAVEISIETPEGPLVGSPWIVTDWRAPTCYCPQKNRELWRRDMTCNEPESHKFDSEHERVSGSLFDQKLQHFPEISETLITEFSEKFQSSEASVVHYTVLNNQIYRRTLGITDPNKVNMADYALLNLARQVNLPDMEFFMNVGRAPLCQAEHVPIFSWFSTDKHCDLLIPSSDFLASTRCQHRILRNLDSFVGHPWDQKKEKLVYRDSQRLDVEKKLRELGEKDKNNLMDIGDFEQTNVYEYKYIIILSPHQVQLASMLSGNSLIFKVDNPVNEFYFHLLEPFVHYIPVNADLSNLEEQIIWAKEHDDLAQKIVQNAQNLVRSRLRLEDIWCETFDSFAKYASRLNFSPKIRPEMVELVGAEKTAFLTGKSQLCSCTDELDREKLIKEKKEREEEDNQIIEIEAFLKQKRRRRNEEEIKRSTAKLEGIKKKRAGPEAYEEWEAGEAKHMEVMRKGRKEQRREESRKRRENLQKQDL
eukprot:TRINITY_DN6625_c0_g1_i1.p1 TRINITY_DN6625_c0_g1~~TRINITY_DN6625_c0_g1_i1.p1  ORF type:complete len:576 (-),score=132.18 TRINITY_DN6625_c0_g1_i1:125-1852(-)